MRCLEVRKAVQDGLSGRKCLEQLFRIDCLDGGVYCLERCLGGTVWTEVFRTVEYEVLRTEQLLSDDVCPEVFRIVV